MTTPSRPLRIVVMGAGAVGSWLGALLCQAGHHVTLVGRPTHVEAVMRNGLHISGETNLHVQPDATSRAVEAPSADVLLLTVKAYDTAAALHEALPLIGPQTRVVSVQNGLGNIETLTEVLDDRQVFAATTTHGVSYEGPGRVRHAGRGYFRLGSCGNQHAQADALGSMFAASGLEVDVTPHIFGEVWAKVIVNVAINPLTAITGLRNGALLSEPYLTEVMLRAAEEAVDVARAEGAPLPEDDLIERARVTARLTASNKSSMLQDITRGKPTEIDSICGQIIRRGRDLAIDTPTNLTLWAAVKGIEASTYVE